MGNMVRSEQAEYDIFRHSNALIVIKSGAILTGMLLSKSNIYMIEIFIHFGT